MGLIERLREWWDVHRPSGGVLQPISRDLHRDPLIRLRRRI